MEQLVKKVDALELPIAEANLAIVEIRKTLLQQQASVAAMLGDTARVSRNVCRIKMCVELTFETRHRLS